MFIAWKLKLQGEHCLVLHQLGMYTLVIQILHHTLNNWKGLGSIDLGLQINVSKEINLKVRYPQIIRIDCIMLITY